MILLEMWFIGAYVQATTRNQRHSLNLGLQLQLGVVVAIVFVLIARLLLAHLLLWRLLLFLGWSSFSVQFVAAAIAMNVATKGDQ